MTTPFSTKIAAFGVALMMNGAMIGFVAYLFSGELHEPAPVTAFAQTATKDPIDRADAALSV